jgi:hypothetical protein
VAARQLQALVVTLVERRSRRSGTGPPGLDTAGGAPPSGSPGLVEETSR